MIHKQFQFQRWIRLAGAIRESKMDSQESESELRERSRQERRQIVAKYDKGREDGALIDDWEDPTYDHYHKTDRFGFIQ